MTKDILNLFVKDPGYSYHIISKIPYLYSFELEWRSNPGFNREYQYHSEVKLPQPDKNLLSESLGEVLEKRRSIRRYKHKTVEKNVFSTFIYYVAGIKGFKYGYPTRFYPTAGALNSPEFFLYIDMVEKISKGVYHYNPFNHSLELIAGGDFKNDLYYASLEQSQVLDAAFTILVVGVYDRTYSKYGLRAYRYVLEDVGHVGQNIYLVATCLGLGTVCMGAFKDDDVSRLFKLKDRELPLLMYTVGYPVE